MMKHMKKRMVRVLSVGVLGMSFLSACASAPAVPEDAFYRLTPVSDQAGAQTIDGVVEVGRFAASGALGNRPLLMTDRGSNAVTEYNYHFWIESPPSLLQSVLVSSLRSSKVAKQIVTPEMRVTPDYTVTGRVLRMETVRGSQPSGVVAFELSLRNESTGKIVVLKEYLSEVPSSNDRVQDGAKALEQAVNKAFSSFIADVRKASP